MASEIKVDTISEKTSANGVTIDGVSLKDSKIATANSVDSDAYVDGSIDAVHLSANSVDSDAYVDGSIDTVHIDALQVTGAKLNTDVISAQTELASAPADADEFMVSDGGVLKRVDYSLIKGGAMTLIARASDSAAVGSISVDDCFSDTYDYYKIYMFLNAEEDEGEFRFRWRQSSTDITDSYYINVGMASQLTDSANSNYVKNNQWNADHLLLLNSMNENDNLGDTTEITVYDPRARDEGNLATIHYSCSNYRSDDIWVSVKGAAMYGNQGSGDDYDGFTIYYSNGDIKNYDYAIYGMNKT